MSMQVLLAGYALSLFAAIVGCVAIARSKHASRSLWWLVGALASGFIGLMLIAGHSLLPSFLSYVVANEVMLFAFVLLHQAVASILGSRRRYVGISLLLLAVQFFAFLHYTYAEPQIRTRIFVRTTAILIQVAISAAVLFRHKDPNLRYHARVAGWGFAVFALAQASRLVATAIWPPMPDRLHPDALQAFYAVINFILALGSCFAVAWLALCAQRNNLQEMATTDELSGLRNRRGFDEILGHELKRSERSREPLALLLIDLDHFKTINDRYGHPVGDEVIRRVSRLLYVNTRAMDAVARYGGEEFAMILTEMSFAQAESIAERLRMQIEAMAGLPESIRVTASIGIAMKQNGDTVASLFKRSDDALYSSKRAGRNQVSSCLRLADAAGDLYLV